MASVNIRRKYSKNPPADTVRFIIKTITEVSACGQYASLRTIAHRYLLFSPVIAKKSYPDAKGFKSACAYIHSLGVFYFDKNGRATVVNCYNTADTLEVVSMADAAISLELQNINSSCQTTIFAVV